MIDWLARALMTAAVLLLILIGALCLVADLLYLLWLEDEPSFEW